MAKFPGLESLFASIESKIRSNYDGLICFIHWNVVNKGFRCVGHGDDTSSSNKKSELLPAMWNSSQEEYVIRYVPENSEDQHLLKCIVMGDTLLVNFMRLKDEKVSSLTLDVDQYVNKEHLKDFDRIYRDKELLHQLINDDLMAPLNKNQTPSTSSQQAQSTRQSTEQRQGRERETDPLRDPDPLRDTDPLRIPPRHPGQAGRPEWGQPRDPFAVGGDDLDPFGPGGAGMLMDPFRGGMPHRGIDPGIGMPGGRLPRGAVPPGARFDPIGPPRPGGPGGGPQGGFDGGPDPDHLPPPGYDDMFM
ncbi:proteasome inhibitor PI31 subunit-like isoform X1 [Lytechinus variegatus]|uniref:proteasome inhibitor PI31 subunit-like isoform X1 n=1 Tax=Lytechinus variegatus TaxID=7654 RepID=UPI001BB16C02|nr:proteasome inhibitor PI31 subunit-like isoform X1 [Lytechinus variegatus]